MANPIKNTSNLLLWNADTPFITHLKDLKEVAKEKANQGKYCSWTYLLNWTIISNEEELEKVVWSNVKKVLCLAELQWNKNNPILFEGLELIKIIRFQKSSVIPVAIASFLPFEMLKRVTNNDPVLHELQKGKNFIELKNEDWIERTLDNYFLNTELTKILILRFFFEKVFIAETEDEHNTLYQIVDDIKMALGTLRGFNHFSKSSIYRDKMVTVFKTNWELAEATLKLIRDCLIDNTLIKKILPEEQILKIQEIDSFFEYTSFANEDYAELYFQVSLFSKLFLKIQPWHYRIKEI